MDENIKNENKIPTCPFCKSIINSSDTYCKTCGYVFDNASIESKQQLRFGKKDLSDAVSVTNDTSSDYLQKNTRKIKIVNEIKNFTFLILGILSFLMIVLPLFSKSNIYTYSQQVDEYYNFSLPEYFAINRTSNAIGLLIKNITYFFEHNDIAGPALIFSIYNFATLAICSSISVIGSLLIISSIRVLFFKKQSRMLKRFVGIISVLSLILTFGFTCYGFFTIALIAISLISLIFLYVIEIISKEKEFHLNHFIHKTICSLLLFVMLIFSSFRLIKLNVIAGEKLYNYSTISEPFNDMIIYCRGIFLEFMQFVQSTSGDAVFAKYTLTTNILSIVFHFIYLIATCVAIVELFYSLSNQNIKFPIRWIIIATIGFYLFTTSILFYNKLITDATINKYISEVGQVEFGKLSKEQIQAITKEKQVFSMGYGLLFSMIIFLPISIYAIISKALLAKKTF